MNDGAAATPGICAIPWIWRRVQVTLEAAESQPVPDDTATGTAARQVAQMQVQATDRAAAHQVAQTQAIDRVAV
jgi:hypothetical protein